MKEPASKPAKKTAAPAKVESKSKWPVIRTVRKLQVPLSDDDIRNLGRENAHIGAEIEALTAAKKASTQNFAAQITERSTKRGVNDAAISNGWSEREVECEWRYEQNRAGKVDKSRKVLVRLDTEKIVDEAFITDDERQIHMKLDPAPVETQPQADLPLPDFMAAEKKAKRKTKAEKAAEDAAREKADIAADDRVAVKEAEANS